MAVSFDASIERVLHQPRMPDSAAPPIFPDQKATRPLGIHEPSNLEKIFNTSYARSLIEKMIYPRVPENDVMLPSAYSELLDRLRKKISTDNTELKNVNPKKVKRAQTLLKQMHDDYQAYCAGRDQLVQG